MSDNICSSLIASKYISIEAVKELGLETTNLVEKGERNMDSTDLELIELMSDELNFLKAIDGDLRMDLYLIVKQFGLDFFWKDSSTTEIYDSEK